MVGMRGCEQRTTGGIGDGIASDTTRGGEISAPYFFLISELSFPSAPQGFRTTVLSEDDMMGTSNTKGLFNALHEP